MEKHPFRIVLFVEFCLITAVGSLTNNVDDLWVKNHFTTFIFTPIFSEILWIYKDFLRYE